MRSPTTRNDNWEEEKSEEDIVDDNSARVVNAAEVVRKSRKYECNVGTRTMLTALMGLARYISGAECAPPATEVNDDGGVKEKLPFGRIAKE